MGGCRTSHRAAREVLGVDRIVGGGLCSNLDVPDNRHAGGSEQIQVCFLSGCVPDVGGECPFAKTVTAEISLLPPPPRLVGVPPFHPGPQCSIHLMVYIGEGLLGDDVTVMVGPAPELSVQ